MKTALFEVEDWEREAADADVISTFIHSKLNRSVLEQWQGCRTALETTRGPGRAGQRMDQRGWRSHGMGHGYGGGMMMGGMGRGGMMRIMFAVADADDEPTVRLDMKCPNSTDTTLARPTRSFDPSQSEPSPISG